MVQIIKSNWWWGSWWGGGWEWDMKKSVYDPNNVGKNVYDYTYFTNKPTIPTKTSDLDNDSGFITNSALSGYQTTANIRTNLTSPDNTHYPSTKAVSDALANKQWTLTAGTGIDITNNVISATGGGWSWDVVWPASSTDWHLAVFDWATGKKIKDWWAMPTIPTKVSQLQNDSWFTTNTGTITSVKMNGTTVASSWEANLWTVITSHQNIKTVNSNSLVWTGNVSINETKVSATAPSSPTEWMVWYDTTNDVLKTYDGSSWNEVWWGWGWEWNTKTFYLSSNSDLTNAQAAYDWYKDGKNPIVAFSWSWATYTVRLKSSNYLAFTDWTNWDWITSWSYSYVSDHTLYLNLSWDTVTSVSLSEATSRNTSIKYLDTNVNYWVPYTPQYNWSPATKKYVDDSVSVVSGDSGTTYTIKVSNSDPASWTASNIITLVP